MRQFKFRAWDHKNKKMLYPIDIHNSHLDFITDSDGSLLLEEILNSLGHTEKYEIMQWTGLIDKNSKEIYDGDIVIYKSEDNWMGYPEEECEICWLDNHISYGWVVRHKKDAFVWSLTRNFASESLEIVGNIFENPELLSNETV